MHLRKSACHSQAHCAPKAPNNPAPPAAACRRPGRVCFVCSCAALWAREARLLDLHDVSLTITRPAQAARLAPWVAARRDRIVRLAVAVAAQSDIEEAHDLEWGLRAVWAALEGAASLEVRGSMHICSLLA